MRRSRQTVIRGRIGVCLLACSLLLASAGCTSPFASTTGQDATQADAPAAQRLTTTLTEDFRNTDLGCGWEPTRSVELAYACCFTLDEYEGGYCLACLADGGRYLVVPEGKPVPDGLAEDIVVLQQPIGDIYLAASDTMCLFDALGELDRITVSGIERDDWHIKAAREAMDEGTIVYGGKYRAPDYELLLSRGVRLALESTMINHAPDVREKLIELGIPVLTELSSYESEPLGRAEWVRLYGVLCGHDERARELFDEQARQVSSLETPSSDKTVAFFFINSAGSAVVRRRDDYVTKMIEQAGGRSVFAGLEGTGTATGSVTLQKEEFYTLAKDADVIIYNATIDDGIASMADLIATDELLADFKAVQSGDVWVTSESMYQQMIETGAIIADINRALCGATGDLTYLRRLS